MSLSTPPTLTSSGLSATNTANFAANAGDLLVLLFTQPAGSTAPVITATPGFSGTPTLVVHDATNRYVSCYSYNVAPSSSFTSQQFTWTNSADFFLFVIPGAAIPTNAAAGASTGTTPSITAIAATSVLLALFAGTRLSGTGAPTWTAGSNMTGYAALGGGGINLDISFCEASTTLAGTSGFTSTTASVSGSHSPTITEALVVEIPIAVSATLTISPTTIFANTAGQTITLTGTGTSWTSGTPGSPTFTIT